MSKKILVSALEPSSNLHLKEILSNGNLDIVGIFDDSLGGVLYSSKEFSVMGIIDVIPKIAKAKKAIKEMAILSKKCEKVLLIDAPAFNIPLAKAIKKINPTIKIIYYILPKAWIWKKDRIKKIEKYCDLAASIFPFEKEFYQNSIYVGNPLLDEIKEYKKNITNDINIVAFLPGSRKSEIKSLMPIFKDVAKEIKGKKILVIPKHFTNEEVKELYGDILEFIIYHDTPKALLNSDFAFVCSGTASLEAAIVGTPFVLVYKAKKIDFFIAKLFIKNLKFVGLANIIFDFLKKPPLHKELLQENLTKENLINELNQIDKLNFFKNSRELIGILSYGSSSNVFSLLKE